MKTRKITYTAVMIAVGVLLPQVFHLIGGTASGGTFLPMHLPVLLAGLLLGPISGVAVGIICPVLSFAITGMPAATKLPFMIAELVTYGIVSGITSKKFRLNCYLSLIIAMVVGRIINAMAMYLGLWLFNMEVSPLVAVWTAAVSGVAGIVIQLVFVPILYKLLIRTVEKNDRN